MSMQGIPTSIPCRGARPLQHSLGGAAEQVVEQGPVVVEEGPQQVEHGKDDMLPFTVGQDVLLLSGLHAAGAAGL